MGVEKKQTCIFCGRKDALREKIDDIFNLDCVNCGNYSIEREAYEDLPYELEHKYKKVRHLISGLLRELSEREISFGIITNDNFENLIKDMRIPKTIQEKIDKFILHIYRQTKFFKQEIHIISNHLAVGYALNEEELKNMVEGLKELDYLDNVTVFGVNDGRFADKCVAYFRVQLSLKGIERAEFLLKEQVDSKQCFVAMWFDETMLNVFDEVISKAIIDAGYKPLIISMKEHNGDITDEIIAEIRKSKFVVADFTGQRGGVYYEAGFAYGLGLPVIWTCHEDWFNKENEVEKEVEIDGQLKKGLVKEMRRIHFDINHYNFLVWEDEDDLYNKLKNRILATIPNNK